MEYEIVIGLEVHVQLKTKSKAFCGCSTEFGQSPNSQVCPVCLGFPGSLPVLNQTALEYAAKVGAALNCEVQEYTKFDRKHYYYPDLPKNYQISQYDLPVAIAGYLDIELNERSKRIRIKRVHFEEDAGKLIHQGEASLVDYNRAGMPLLEIVSEPDINTPQEAYEYLTDLKSIVQYLGVSDCDMEKGTLRCDANISLRPKGEKELGVKTELKNLNSFKAVRDGLAYEAQRQEELLRGGGVIKQETRLWADKELKTISMRSKEEAKDYRYFPEPDLPPFILSKGKIEGIKKTIPELAKEKVARFISGYGLSKYDAKVLTAFKADAEFCEQCFQAYPREEKKGVVNWLIGPLMSEMNSRNRSLTELGVSPRGLIELIAFAEKEEISLLSAKAVLSEMIDSGKAAGDIIKEKGMAQISDASSLEAIAEAVFSENAKTVKDFKSGNANAVMFLVGQVMKKSRGKANPKVVQEILKRRLTDA